MHSAARARAPRSSSAGPEARAGFAGGPEAGSRPAAEAPLEAASPGGGGLVGAGSRRHARATCTDKRGLVARVAGC